MNALIGGKKVPDNLLGKLKKSSLSNFKNTGFSDKLEEDGYLFIPNAIDVSEIKTARNDIFKKLNEVDELEDPYNEGIFSGKSIRDKIHSDRGVFWESISSGKSLRNITNGKNLEAIFSKIFEEPAIGFDFIFLRAVAGGKFTHMHCDSGFFTRSTKKVLTCWLVFTEITLDKGPLFVVEGSHKFDDIKKQFLDFDVAIHKDRKATIDVHPVQFAKERNTKLLTADFNPGDVLIFGMQTVHGTFENHAKDKKIRLTCDIRFQPKSEPKDPRYFGLKPGGTTGAGYGELNSARPLNEDWHIR